MADIAFPNIPATELIPLFQLDWGNSAQFQPGLQTSLLIGPTTNTNSDVAPQLIANTAMACTNWGARSMIASMAERYIDADPYGSVWGFGLADNAGGTAATGTITITGSATAAGTLSFYIAGRYVPVAVSNGDNLATIVTNVVTAINSFVDSSNVGRFQKKQGDKGVKLPCTAASSLGVITLTAANKGTLGNAIDVELNYKGVVNQETIPPGLTVTIVAMASGATDPLTNGLATALANTAFDFICIPFCTQQSLTDYANLLSNATGRWSWASQIYGHIWTARISADANGSDALSFCASAYADDQNTTCVQAEATTPSPPWDIAATWMGAAAASLRADPALPLQTLALPNLMAPRRHKEFPFSVRESLLAAGVALMSYNPDRSCQIQRAVTTYTTDTNGSPDSSYRDTETLYTLMAVVRQLKGDCLAQFSRVKLAGNGSQTGAGNIATPSSIRSALQASYQTMINNGWVQNLAGFSKGLVVQQNSADATRVDVLFDPILVSGLRVLGILTQFSLQA